MPTGWFWEHDKPLRFEAGWLSPSTREFVIELETVTHKRKQVEHIATHITKKWFFKRKDGLILYGDASGRANITSRWQGASSWAGQQ